MIDDVWIEGLDPDALKAIISFWPSGWTRCGRCVPGSRLPGALELDQLGWVQPVIDSIRALLYASPTDPIPAAMPSASRCSASLNNVYTSKRSGDACRRWGVWQSMGRVGPCFDNAVSEAFNSVLKVEYVHRQHFRSRAETRIKIGAWIADFSNTRRMHSACGFLSPVKFEGQYWVEQALQEAAQKLSTLRGDRQTVSAPCR
jgi:hypothetical protein